VTRASAPDDARSVGGGARRRRPPARLRAHVVGYTGYRLSGAPVARRLNLPSATLTLCLTWGAPLDLAPDGEPTPGRRWDEVLLGLRTSPVISRTSGTGHLVQVELTPLGGYELLGVPLRHLTGATVRPADVLGRHWDAGLTERLARAPGWEARWQILDEALSARLAAGRCPPSPVVSEAWSLLRASHGTLSVGRLAEETGRSRRRLEVLFAEQIGLAPKTAARVLRFQRALTMLPGPCTTWAGTAAACGYHDQAHLTREFRALAGVTPTGLQALALRGDSGGALPVHPLTSVLAPF
jgi:AraC-type DNA-binding domain-containing proteins